MSENTESTATVQVALGSIEIIDRGKKVPVKKGLILSLEAKIKVAPNGKLEVTYQGNQYAFHNNVEGILKTLLAPKGKKSGSEPTSAGGVRG